MQVTVNEKSKIVEMWLTEAERDDVQFRETLKPMYATLKQKGYLVAVFLSGDGDLYEATRDLLLYNRRSLAAQAVLRDKCNPQ